jgi:hypothetical protein
MKVGMRVRDRWYVLDREGTVVEVLKTRVKLRFGDFAVTYDKAHCQFLEKAE